MPHYSLARVVLSYAEERRIVEQWRSAAPVLAAQRCHELRRLTEEEALAAAITLLELLPLLPPRERGSGLVEQQRLFSRCA